MPQKNSKNKGSGFERLIARKLSLWLSNGERDDWCYRTHSSGGRFTVRMKESKNTHGQSGDIASTHPGSELFIENFNIEIKSYRDINLWSMFTGSKGGILDFWNQTKRDSKSSHKRPALIVKQNNKPILLLVDNIIAAIFYQMKLCPKIMIHMEKGSVIYVYLFEDFLKLDSQIFIKKMEKEKILR